MINIPVTLPTQITDKYDIIGNAFIRKDKGKKAEEREVEIGDIHSEDFQPQFKLKRWENECNFSVRLIDDDPTKPKIETEENKIKFIKKDIEAHFYDVPKIGEMPDCFEFEVLLKKKPKTNKIQMSVETKGLKFYKQPPLTEEYKNGYSEEFKKEIIVTETDVKDLDGNILCHRPINVVNSVAVYHESKAGDYSKMGLKNYRAGKAFHIYRPRIIDNAGKEVWGKLNITDNLLTVEIPQEFLDNAVYPIRHAAGLTFGTDPASPGGSSAIGNATYWYSSNHTLSEEGTVSSVSFYMSQPTSAYRRYGIYTKSGTTYTKQQQTDESPQGILSVDWHLLNLETSTLFGADTYYLAIQSTGNWTYYYDVATGRAYKSDSYSQGDSLPASISSPYLSDRLISAYCTYTAGGPPAGGGEMSLNTGFWGPAIS